MMYNKNGGKPALVVIVNDDITQLALMSGFLEKEDMKVHPFSNVESALKAMTHEITPDLIITDLYMPDIDGWRLCRLLRSPEYPFLNKVPIMVVSATFSGDEVSRLTAELGANAFLPSPINRSNFVEEVHRLLQGETARIKNRVLIVDDNAELSEMLQQTFNRHGYHADYTVTGTSAKEKILQNDYQVVIIDHHLPDFSGESLLEECKYHRPDAIVVMITGDTNPQLAVKWMKMGASAYLRKPFENSYLLHVCDNARREKSLLRIETLLELRTHELRASEEKYRIVADFTYDWEYWLGPDGKFRYMSPSAERITGHPSTAFIDQPQLFYDIIHPEDRDCISLLKNTIQENPVHREIEFRIITRNKKTRWMSHRNSSIYLQNGNFAGSRVSIRDITERKNAEEALKRREVELKRAQEIAKLGSWVIDILNETLEWSDQTYRIFEIPIGTPMTLEVFLTRVHKDDRLKHDQAWQAALKGAPYNFEHRIVIKDKTKWVREQAEMLKRDANGHPLIGIGTVQDITESKLLEEQLREAQKIEAIGQLAGGVAHDFNNILSAILMQISLLQSMDNADNEIQSALKELESDTQRAAELTRQLLVFSRRTPVQVKVLDLNELVGNLLKMLRRLIGEHVNVQFKAKSALPLIEADPSLMDQVLINLAVNARDAMPKGGLITISTESATFDSRNCDGHPDRRQGTFVCMSVSDTGCGMNEATLARIFEPFFTTKEVGKGTGLGLATVYGIVKQHSGWIEVQSTIGSGSSFLVYLPVSAKPSVASVVASENKQLLQGTECILLVEDEQSVRQMAKICLRKYGYRVYDAANALEALKCWDQFAQHIDLLVTDMIMPENMDGFDLALRLQMEKPTLKVIIASGYSTDIPLHSQLAEAGIVFLPKPFAARSLCAKVRECLDNPGS